MLDNVEGLLRTVDVYDKYISEGYAHLEVNLCKGCMWKLCVVLNGLHFPVLLHSHINIWSRNLDIDQGRSQEETEEDELQEDRDRWRGFVVKQPTS
jgi:hypothetical protein